MNSDDYKYLRFNIPQETRWATREEIEQSSTRINLNDENYKAAGIPLLSDGEQAYVDNLDTHSLIFGATGSKKTRLFCMPMVNIFAKAGESFVVTDPKGEIYAQTSGLVKSKGYKTIVLNFRDIGKGDKWNPLSIPVELWRAGLKDEAGLMLSDFVSAISEKFSANSKDPFWPEAAQALSIANLYVLMEAAKPEEVNLTSFSRLCAYSAVEQLKQLNKMMDSTSVPSLNYQSTISIRAESTVSGIVSSLYGMLRSFNINKKLSNMLSKNTFDARSIGREKTAVYLIVPDEKTTFNFLITMFIKQVYELLISEAQKRKNRQLPIRVNFVLDEFCNIPKIPDMPSMISAARSRNMRFFLVAQSLHQLKGKYGEEAETIKGNCDNWIFLASRELALLNEISNLCGNIVSSDGRERKMISTSELQRLSKEKGEALVMHARQYPFISEMADISMYKMFGTEPEVPMCTQEDEPLNVFSLSDLMTKIARLEAIAPFASDEHKLLQASRIYKKEMSACKIEPRKTEPHEVRRGHQSIFAQKGNAGEKSNATEISKAEQKRRQAECEKKARKKIAALLGEEYAAQFFANKLFEFDLPDIDDDDDNDWPFNF